VKFHFLGDYVRHIRLFGTTDSYSTQIVSKLMHAVVGSDSDLTTQSELAHRLIKRLYGLTNKKNAMTQIGKKYVRKEVFRDGEDHWQEEQEASTNARLQDHHYISSSRNTPVHLFDFLLSSPNDPAKKVCNHVFDSLAPR
jgi:hypothetical protein